MISNKVRAAVRRHRRRRGARGEVVPPAGLPARGRELRKQGTFSRPAQPAAGPLGPATETGEGKDPRGSAQPAYCGRRQRRPCLGSCAAALDAA